MFCEKLIWPSNFRNFDILKCLLYDSNFRNVQSFASFLKRLYFTVLQFLIESWFDYQISEILSFWNVCYKAQVSSCSIAFLRTETLIFHCSEMFEWKVDLTIKFQKFWHFEMSAIWLNFRNVQSFASFLKRLYFTVLQCLIESWFELSNFRNFVILKCLL